MQTVISQPKGGKERETGERGTGRERREERGGERETGETARQRRGERETGAEREIGREGERGRKRGWGRHREREARR